MLTILTSVRNDDRRSDLVLRRSLPDPDADNLRSVEEDPVDVGPDQDLASGGLDDRNEVEGDL